MCYLKCPSEFWSHLTPLAPGKFPGEGGIPVTWAQISGDRSAPLKLNPTWRVLELSRMISIQLIGRGRGGPWSLASPQSLLFANSDPSLAGCFKRNFPWCSSGWKMVCSRRFPNMTPYDSTRNYALWTHSPIFTKETCARKQSHPHWREAE